MKPGVKPFVIEREPVKKEEAGLSFRQQFLIVAAVAMVPLSMCAGGEGLMVWSNYRKTEGDLADDYARAADCWRRPYSWTPDSERCTFQERASIVRVNANEDIHDWGEYTLVGGAILGVSLLGAPGL